jgi:hypothetical protein
MGEIGTEKTSTNRLVNENDRALVGQTGQFLQDRTEAKAKNADELKTEQGFS